MGGSRSARPQWRIEPCVEVRQSRTLPNLTVHLDNMGGSRAYRAFSAPASRGTSGATSMVIRGPTGAGPSQCSRNVAPSCYRNSCSRISLRFEPSLLRTYWPCPSTREDLLREECFFIPGSRSSFFSPFVPRITRHGWRTRTSTSCCVSFGWKPMPGWSGGTSSCPTTFISSVHLVDPPSTFIDGFTSGNRILPAAMPSLRTSGSAFIGTGGSETPRATRPSGTM